MGGSFFSAPKVKITHPPPPEDASKIALKQQKLKQNSAANFVAQNRLMGPIQLQAPGIRY